MIILYKLYFCSCLIRTPMFLFIFHCLIMGKVDIDNFLFQWGYLDFFTEMSIE